uniref:Hypothetical secreted peptide n=1 Tax=Glossina morsitans morsitans TaxID=37546 RepID=D3TSR8_GLOMM
MTLLLLLLHACDLPFLFLIGNVGCTQLHIYLTKRNIEREYIPLSSIRSQNPQLTLIHSLFLLTQCDCINLSVIMLCFYTTQ